MRPILPLVTAILLLSSCSKYQYLRLSSTDTPLNDMNEFVVENDTFRIVYRFQGYGGPVQVAVVNKSTMPLSVDWSKSFLIRNGRPQLLHDPAVKIDGELERSDAYSNSSAFNAIATRQQALEFIPPQSSISQLGGSLLSTRFIKTDGYTMERSSIDVDGFRKKIKKTGFTEKNSPLAFRVYLALVPGDHSGPPVFVDRSFYISELIATKVEPQWMSGKVQGNMVILQRSTAGGTILGTVATLGIILALTQLEAEPE